MIKTIVDLRGSFGAARDQNPRPTCLAFAASDTHAALRPGWYPLSAEWAYYHAVKRDGGLPQDGSTLVSMLATIKSDGQPEESEWPYIQTAAIDISSWLGFRQPAHRRFSSETMPHVERRLRMLSISLIPACRSSLR
jgi:hypothetical protein